MLIIKHLFKKENDFSTTENQPLISNKKMPKHSQICITNSLWTGL